MRQDGSAISLKRELPIMAFSFMKWLILATMAGVLVGLGASFFIILLNKGLGLSEHLPGNWRLLLLPFGFLASTALVKNFAPTAKGHGTEKVIEAVHEKEANIDVKVVPVKLAATVVTLACGGSAGKEGPAAQIGAGLMSVVARLLRFSTYDRTRLVICGVSAGFAAIFGTPVAGAVFGIEVLFIGQVFYDVLFPSIISGVVSWKVVSALGILHPSFHFDPSLVAVTPAMLLWVSIGSVFFGLVAILNVSLMTFFEKLFDHLKVNYLLKALIGAVSLIILALFVGKEYLGLGMTTIDQVLTTGLVFSTPMLFAFFWKSLFTSITLSCGGSGGVVTPIFYIGVTAGVTFATIFGLNTQLFAGLGMVSLLAACTNAPVASILMGLELFGSSFAPLVALSCIGAFLMVGHRSIYPSQKLSRSKTSLITLGQPERIDRATAHMALHNSIIVTSVRRLEAYQLLKKRKKHHK